MINWVLCGTTMHMQCIYNQRNIFTYWYKDIASATQISTLTGYCEWLGSQYWHLPRWGESQDSHHVLCECCPQLWTRPREPGFSPTSSIWILDAWHPTHYWQAAWPWEWDSQQVSIKVLPCPRLGRSFNSLKCLVFEAYWVVTTCFKIKNSVLCTHYVQYICVLCGSQNHWWLFVQIEFIYWSW